ncbi:MAG: hypothetical protein WCO26_06780 [Deltaproteobacteria bacterium]
MTLDEVKNICKIENKKRILKIGIVSPDYQLWSNMCGGVDQTATICSNNWSQLNTPIILFLITKFFTDGPKGHIGLETEKRVNGLAADIDSGHDGFGYEQRPSFPCQQDGIHATHDNIPERESS